MFSRAEGKGRDIARGRGRLPGSWGVLSSPAGCSTQSRCYAEAARAIRGARALVVATGAGMGIDSGPPRLPGRPGVLEGLPGLRAASASPSWTRPIPTASRRTRPSAGASTATGSTSTGTPFPTTATGSCSTGWTRLSISRIRRHLQRGRPVPEGRLRPGAGPRGPRVHPSPPVHGALRATTSGSARRTCRWTSTPCGRDDSRLPSLPARGPPQHPHVRRRGLAARPVAPSQGAALRGLPRRARRGAGSWCWRLGAGTAVATIRCLSERLGRLPGATVIRVNPREADIRPRTWRLPVGALEALRAIDRALRSG